MHQVIEANRNELKGNKMTFVEVFIQPKYKARVAEKYNRFEQALINQDLVTVEELKADLLEDFSKYHILNDPEELLVQFIKSTAPDARLHAFSELYEKLLTRAIEFAKLAEIQDILMDAVQDGVALNAKSRFDKHMLSFSGGEFSMGSDEMVNYMTNHLIMDGQFDTALMFLEKLGLNEQYVKHAAENFDYDAMRKIITEAHTMADNFTKFQNDIDADIAKAQAVFEDNNCDYVSTLEDLRKAIADKAQTYSMTDDMIGPLLFGVDTVEYNCETNPNAQKNLLFVTVMQTSKQKMVSAVTEEISGKDAILASNATILNFINNIMLPAESESDKLRAEVNTEFEKLAQLKQSYLDLQDDENSDKI